MVSGRAYTGYCGQGIRVLLIASIFASSDTFAVVRGNVLSAHPGQSGPLLLTQSLGMGTPWWSHGSLQPVHSGWGIRHQAKRLSPNQLLLKVYDAGKHIADRDSWDHLGSNREVDHLLETLYTLLIKEPQRNKGLRPARIPFHPKMVNRAIGESLSKLGHAGRTLPHLAFLHAAVTHQLTQEWAVDKRYLLNSLLTALEHLPQMIEVVEPEGGLSAYAYAQQWGTIYGLTERLRHVCEDLHVDYQARGYGVANLRLRVRSSTLGDVLPILGNDEIQHSWEIKANQGPLGTVHFYLQRKLDLWPLTALDLREPVKSMTFWRAVYLVLTDTYYAMSQPLTARYQPQIVYWQQAGLDLLRAPLRLSLSRAGKGLAIGAGVIEFVDWWYWLGGWMAPLEAALVVGGLTYAIIRTIHIPLLKRIVEAGKTTMPTPKEIQLYTVPGQAHEIARPHSDAKALQPGQRLIDPVGWSTDPGQPVRAYEVGIISDTHIKDPHNQWALMRDMLTHNRFKRLILLGDIIDYEITDAMPPEQRAVIGQLLTLADQGVKITYVPGNHDAQWRSRIGKGIALKAPSGRYVTIPVKLYERYTLEDGRVMLMEHGDSRDGYVLDRKMLQHLGSWAVGALLDLDHWVFKERERLGIYSDFSYTIFGKQWVKDWLMDYRDRAVSSAQRRGADIVVVGHNHIAEMRYLDGMLYINTGDSQNPLHSNMVGVRALRTGQTRADIELLEWQRPHGSPEIQPFRHATASSA